MPQVEPHAAASSERVEASSFRRRLYGSIGMLLAQYARLVHASTRLVAEPAEFERSYTTHFPFVAAMWHGQNLMLPYVNQRGMPVDIIVARHADAEISGAALERFGFRLLRGAGARAGKRDKGGTEALRAAVRSIRAGRTVGLSAEVPPGPARRATLGTVMLAKLSGAPIRPIAAATTHYVAFNTWSRMTINLPFGRLALVMGEPIRVAREADDAELERKRSELQQALDRVTMRAYELAGARIEGSLPAHLAPVPSPGLLLSSYRRAAGLLAPLAPWLLKGRLARGKEDSARIGERYGIASRDRPDGELVWVHAASVGEMNAVLPVMAELGARRRDLRFLLTTGTVTSAAIAAERLRAGDIHQYVPLDAPVYCRRFLEHWRPSLAILTESDVWPNMVLEVARRGIPIAVVNGRISAKSFASWVRRSRSSRAIFGHIQLAVTQNDRMAMRYLRLGARDAVAVGNVKVDAPAPPVDRRALEELRGAIGDRPVLVAASTHPGEETLVASAHKLAAERLPGLLTIIVPRHPERGGAVVREIADLGLKVARRSHGELPTGQEDIYVADTLGELGTFYALAPVAFLGGSLVEHGGQNPIEAIRHGAGVLVGPHRMNFRDIYKSLLTGGGAHEVTTPEALAREAAGLLGDKAALEALGARGQLALAELEGALERTVTLLGERFSLFAGEEEGARAS